MTKNVYIHIPFCKSKCNYCSFISFPAIEMKKIYLNALEFEIKTHYKGEKLNTLYFGGGTPSLLTSNEFKRFIELFNITPNTEITTELNPENITLKYMEKLSETQINRISFGCQTFDNDILKIIGRRHNASDVENAVKYAKNVGFNNISLDFIYGLPTQTLSGFENDLKRATALDIEHISLYGLKIEENCFFFNNPPKNIPSDDAQADMYLKAIETLKDFEHYEISNFSKIGFNSKHNLNYWNNNNYYGFGIAAHGYENNVRYFNTSNLQKYINMPTKHESEHKLTKQEQLEEEIFLGFRKTSGINVENINKKFNINFRKKYYDILKKHIEYKYISETKTGFALTTKGILISNIILSEFLE